VAWHRNEISQGRYPNIYIITGEDSEIVTVLNRLGNPDITLASTLSRNPRAAMKFKGRAWRGNRSTWGRSRKSDDWADEKELTVGQGGFYVTTLNLDPQTPEETPLSLGSLIGSLRKLDLMDHKVAVWGINKTNSRLIAEDSNWVEFTTWARQQIAAYLSGNQVEHRLTMAAEARHFASEVGVTYQVIQLNDGVDVRFRYSESHYLPQSAYCCSEGHSPEWEVSSIELSLNALSEARDEATRRQKLAREAILKLTAEELDAVLAEYNR